jgi:hypothetical protein
MEQRQPLMLSDLSSPTVSVRFNLQIQNCPLHTVTTILHQTLGSLNNVLKKCFTFCWAYHFFSVRFLALKWAAQCDPCTMQGCTVLDTVLKILKIQFKWFGVSHEMPHTIHADYIHNANLFCICSQCEVSSCCFTDIKSLPGHRWLYSSFSQNWMTVCVTVTNKG